MLGALREIGERFYTRFGSSFAMLVELVERDRMNRAALDAVLSATRLVDFRARRFRWRRPAGTAGRRGPTRRLSEAWAARFHVRDRGPPRRRSPRGSSLVTGPASPREK